MCLGYIQKWHLFCNDCFVRNISVLLHLLVYSVNFSILENVKLYTSFESLCKRKRHTGYCVIID